MKLMKRKSTALRLRHSYLKESVSSAKAIHLMQVSLKFFLHHCFVLVVELIKNNAALGAKIAVAMSGTTNYLQKNVKEIYSKTVEHAITIIGGAAVDIIS